MQLGGGEAALFLQEGGDAGEGRDVGIGPDAEVAIGVAADGVDDQRLGHDAAGAADGVFGEVLEVPVGRGAVRGGFVHLHGRDDDAVGKGDAAEREGGKEQRHSAAWALSAWGWTSGRSSNSERRRW